MSDYESAAWAEYDAAADWCAAQGWTGGAGTRLPAGLGEGAAALVAADPAAFGRRVREHAYARAMECVLPEVAA